MKTKRILSLLLALVMVFGSLQAMCGFAASALVYDSSVLDYMIENPTSYRVDRYTEESYLFYTNAFAAAKEVYNNSSATADQINAAVADLAAAEAALTYVGAPYSSALNLRAPNALNLAESSEIKFKDAMSNGLSNITATAEFANITEFTPTEDGFYTATVTATGATGTTATVTVSYECNGETYTFNIHFLVVSVGASTANKAKLGATLAYEYAKNRQARDFSGGFQTYQSVIKGATESYVNSTTTQTKVDRAVDNIALAVNSLESAYADYSEIYRLVALVNELNPDNYDSFTAVTQALDLVVYDYPAENQDVVDAMADKLQTAIDGLTLKVSRYTVNCVTADGTLLGSTTYDGTRTYVVRVTAPVYPGYEPTEQYQTVTLTGDEHSVTFTYNPVTYYAYFNANGGTVDVASKELTYDAEYGELPVATRDGYSFLGWFSDPVTGEQIFAETMVTVNYVETLYAHWSDVETYTFNFDAGLGSACDSITASYGDEITMPTPYLYGHTFLGWYYEDGTLASYTTMPDVGNDGDVVTLTAKYTEAVYDVTLDAGENGVVSSTAYSVKYGSAYGDIPAATREGHTFVGWFTEPEGGTQVTAATVVELESAHTLYAQYTVNTYTLAFEMDGGDEIASITAPYGTPIVLDKEPSKLYYLFAGWTLDGNEYTLTTMPAASEVGGTTTITAVWTLNTLVSYYLDAYKTVDGVRIPATTIKAGDAIEVEVSIKTNFGVGQCVFGILFDKNVFSLAGKTVANTITIDTKSPYYATLKSKSFSGAVAYGVNYWAKYFEDDTSTPGVNEADPVINRTDFQCIRIQCGTYDTAKTPNVLNEKTRIFTLKMTVNDDVAADTVASGLITIDGRMARSYINNTNAYVTYVTNQKLTESTGLYSTADTINTIPDFSNSRLELTVAEEDTELGALTGSTTVVDYENRYVYGLAEELTLDSFKTDYAKVIGTGTIECADSVLKTGSVIKVMNNGVCRAEYTVIIYGDVDSNGVADGNDSFIVNMIDSGMLTADALTAAQQLAADPNHDGVINAADATLLEDAGLLKQVVSQVPNA